jgi:hypothetical protein
VSIMDNNKYTDDDRQRVLAECRETLTRTRTIPKPSDDLLYSQPLESQSDRWRREATEAEAEQERKRMLDRATDAEWARMKAAFEVDWRSVIDAAVEAAVAAERERLLKKILPEVLGHFSRQIQRLQRDLDAMKRDQQTKSSNVTDLIVRKPA